MRELRNTVILSVMRITRRPRGMDASLDVGRSGRRAARCRRRGFTLTELMVVVVIAGILAAIAVRSLTKHVSASHSIEALTMVQSIRAAQERYRSMHSVYLDVSQSNTWYPRDPSAGHGGADKTTFFQAPGDAAHPDNARWLTLNPTVAGPVMFGYRTTAGLPGEGMTAPAVEVSGLNWPSTNEPWYVIEAIADADGDKVTAYYLASSINGEVFRQNEGE